MLSTFSWLLIHCEFIICVLSIPCYFTLQAESRVQSDLITCSLKAIQLTVTGLNALMKHMLFVSTHNIYRVYVVACVYVHACPCTDSENGLKCIKRLNQTI